MLDLNSSFFSQCPECKWPKIESSGLLFQGKHILTQHECPTCSLKFWSTLPIGHDRLFPIQIAEESGKVYCEVKDQDWLSAPLAASLKSETSAVAEFKIIRPQTGNQAIFINCLDSCFGHVFTKVWNAYLLKERYPQYSIIVLISSQSEWLCPKEEVEVWSIGLPVNLLDQKVEGLDSWIKSQLMRFEEVFLSQVPTHLNLELGIKLEEVVKISRFPIKQFSKAPLKINFVLREDRFWHNSKWLDLGFKAAIKFKKLHLIKPFLLRRQNQLVQETVKLLLQAFPQAEISVSGLGISGSFAQPIQDQRVAEIHSDSEIQRNQAYSHCQLVIGVHGSHMLVPTALAAGFINLVPAYKLPHWVEDTLLPYQGRLLQWMGRFLNEFSSPQYLASHAIGMISGFDTIWTNLQEKGD
ncbi:hypothetical protein SAMN04488104_100736 [Algoriphagus faecimaris]|uniref:Glycosyltransferase family 9 (Heptosyltransferase) n=1 Tax=Algoriphagus faecimaris TaxID=686796 RepID=A0A1G6PSS0_9BACT|nr:hypothetical protein [Algoriphagus faecimaris]SDC83280.1 hypothetical protein SAMN04488104_100736 [Algoriphagus faecimaris]